MKSSKPPELATWMLRHLTPGPENEALSGDLLEEFERRRSGAWYWRQVLGALRVSFCAGLRAGWTMIWTIVFTAFWAYALYALTFVDLRWPPAGAARVLRGLIMIHRYYGRAAGFTLAFILFVAAPLCVFLAGVHKLRRRAFAWGLIAGAVVMLALDALSSPGSVSPVLDFLVLHGLAMYWVVLFKGSVVLNQAIPLLAAMWIAHRVKPKPRAGLPGLTEPGTGFH